MASNLPQVIPPHLTVHHKVGRSNLVGVSCEQCVWPSGCGLVEIGRWRLRCVGYPLGELPLRLIVIDLISQEKSHTYPHCTVNTVLNIMEE